MVLIILLQKTSKAGQIASLISPNYSKDPLLQDNSLQVHLVRYSLEKLLWVTIDLPLKNKDLRIRISSMKISVEALKKTPSKER